MGVDLLTVADAGLLGEQERGRSFTRPSSELSVPLGHYWLWFLVFLYPRKSAFGSILLSCLLKKNQGPFCCFHILSNPFLHVDSALFSGQSGDSPSHAYCNPFCLESEGNEPQHKTTHDFQSVMITRLTDRNARSQF